VRCCGCVGHGAKYAAAPARADVYRGPVDDAEISRFWADARVRGGLNPAGAYLGANVSETLPPPAWSFGSTPAEADRLLEMVLAGRKTATATFLRDYEDEARRRTEVEEAEGDTLVRTEVDVALPEPGLLSIVVDGQERPRALIRTTHVDVVRFGNVDEDHARREGEGSLEDWRTAHRALFAEGARPGEEVVDGTMVVLERFVVVVPAGARRAARRAGLL
jgi:uncharacterized protein YhfF